ncbi:MAG: hypothetical protein M3R50_10820, partial [Bacteroidota bacterium]|nr:hypothetical protein [Bacteroidota bacterium]
MKNKLLCVAYLLLITMTAGAQKSFTLFKQVRYNNTPTSLLPFLQPFALANEKNLLQPDKQTIRKSGIDSFANTCMGTAPINMDLETWAYYPDATLANTIDSFNKVINYFKAVNNHTPIGFYAVPPKQAYQWSSIDPVNNPGGYAGWKHISDKMAPLAANVDLFEPSFYTYDVDTTLGWRKMVDTTVAAIKRYSKTKPIYAFINPQFHGTGTYDGRSPYYYFIDTASWRYELEVLYDRTDGVIIWTSNKDSIGKTISWNVNMPWWQTTKNFMVEKQLSPPFVLDSFKVSPSGNNQNIIWSTAVDTTTSTFIVQRSIDGGANYVDISAPIASISTHYTENNYQYLDNNAPSGSLQYRLKMFNKDGSTTYSDFSVLPVSFISASFKGRLSDKTVLLNWATSSENNNAYFEVLRSADGISFQSIGKVPGNLTTSIEHQYSFTDNNPNSGTNYYKLRQVDIDGNFTYSNIIILKNNASSNFSISPNPAKSNIIVTHPVGDQQSFIRLVQADGKVVFTQNISVGTGQSSLDISKL